MFEQYYHLHHKFRQFPVKQKVQGLAWLDSMFPAGGEITSNAAKDPGAVHGSKTPGYFLLNFCHADVAFTQII